MHPNGVGHRATPGRHVQADGPAYLRIDTRTLRLRTWGRSPAGRGPPGPRGGSAMTRMPRLFPAFLGGPGAVGILVLRLAAGTAMIFHGWPKIQHATSWMGPDARVPGVF